MKMTTETATRYCPICLEALDAAKPVNAKLCGKSSCKGKYQRDRNKRYNQRKRDANPKVQRDLKRSAQFEAWYKAHNELKPDHEPVEIECKQPNRTAWLLSWPPCCNPDDFSVTYHKRVWRLRHQGGAICQNKLNEWVRAGNLPTFKIRNNQS